MAYTESIPSRPIMRYHGSKWRIADWIIGFFPHHFTYIEPFGGSAGVLMRKPRSRAEVYNDLDEDVVNVFSVLRDPVLSKELQIACELTPYARTEFELSGEPIEDPVERARRTLFRAAAGFGSAGATQGKTGFRSYAGSKRMIPTAIDWMKYPQHISDFCQRLQGVLIESRPASDIFERYDGEESLFYVDPPYLMELRNALGECYAHELSNADHDDLLGRLIELKGMVILSGYDSKYYDDKLFPNHWKKVSRTVHGNGHKGNSKRIEYLWINPACHQKNAQGKLF